MTMKGAGHRGGVLAAAVLLLVVAVQSDEYFSEMEKNEALLEVEFPRGRPPAVTTTATQIEVAREPFCLLSFNETSNNWEAVPEHLVDKEEERLLHASWDTVLAYEAEYGSPTLAEAQQIAASNLGRFWRQVMNPTSEELTDDENTVIDTRVMELRSREGLMQDDKGLFFGFLTRGKPKKALKAAMDELYQARLLLKEARDEAERAASRKKRLK